MSLYIKLYTSILLEPAFVTVGADATLLYIKGLCWSLENLTDGNVPKEALPIIGTGIKNPKGCAKKLVSIGLWRENSDGFSTGTEKWAKYQQTKEQVEEHRKKNRERVQNYRMKRSRNEDVTHYDAISNACVTHPDNRSQITDHRSQSPSPSLRSEKKGKDSVIPSGEKPCASDQPRTLSSFLAGDDLERTPSPDEEQEANERRNALRAQAEALRGEA